MKTLLKHLRATRFKALFGEDNRTETSPTSSLMRSAFICASATLASLTIPNAADASSPLNILTVGPNFGNRATEVYVPTSPSPFGGIDHLGTTVTHVNEAGFNALTAEQLATYDVILTQWASSTATDLGSTKVQNYVHSGGALFLDGDYANYNDLSWVGITGAQGSCSGPWTFTTAADPVLTDSLPTSPTLANCHGNFPNFDPSVFVVFMRDSAGRNAALAGQYGSGRIILTGPDQDFHADPTHHAQQYQLLLNELEWTGNPIPTANAGPDQTVNEGQLVVLDGSMSSYGGDGPLGYEWTQIGGTPAMLSDSTVASPSFYAPFVAIGGETLSFELTVTADDQSSSDQVSIQIVNINHEPVADAGINISVAEGSPVTLDGTASFDIDGDPITYTWVQIGGATTVSLSDSNISTPSFIAPSGGSGGATGVVDTLTFQLSVEDGYMSDAPADGYMLGDNVDTVTIEVTNINNDPIANAGPDQTADENNMVTLSGSASNDPDGDTLTYLWTQTSGTAVTLSSYTAVTPSFTTPFVMPGGESLTFELTVDDGFGGFSADQVAIHVQNANDPPNADLATPSINCLWPPNHKLVEVEITGVSDPDSNATISIDSVYQDEATEGLGDGDTAVDAVINDNGTVLLRAERSGKGDGRVYHIAFTASDLEGSDSGVVTVCVQHNRKNEAVDGGALHDSTL